MCPCSDDKINTRGVPIWSQKGVKPHATRSMDPRTLGQRPPTVVLHLHDTSTRTYGPKVDYWTPGLKRAQLETADWHGIATGTGDNTSKNQVAVLVT